VEKKRPNLLRSIGLGLGIIAAIVVYAYGFQVTKVNLAETKSERRQEQLIRIIRALAQPDLVEYDREEFRVEEPIYSPCPDGYEASPQVESTAAYLVITPSCADPRAEIRIEGYNFQPFTEGPVHFVPAESTVNLQVGTVKVGVDGSFSLNARLPNRPSDQVQSIVAITRRNVGTPRFSNTAIDTWDKIVETVFLALLATTLGTALAVPLSFFAARNIMNDVTSNLVSFALSILLIPVGIFLGVQIARLANELSVLITQNVLLIVTSFVLGAAISLPGLRWALPQQEIQRPTTPVRLGRIAILAFIAFILVTFLYLIAHTVMAVGSQLGVALGSLGFLGRFFRDLGDILNMVIPLLTALAGAGLFSSFSGRLGELLARRGDWLVKFSHFFLATLAGAFLFYLLFQGINWFYGFHETAAINIRAPIAIHISRSELGAIVTGALSGMVLGLLIKPAAPIPVGMIVYYVSRTIFNGLRSIEALVMAIVFVVWVGIGPFAGSLALALHTIAALAKLYSEQVESIMAGPLEAVQATGANRLQTIVYAVLPQIVPPYISFTMYRWDINVRMSTIIGFAGGGGIGFLLQQNINLLNYRAASAQMLAIAIVVAAMDYISSKLREKFV
jgi:phosphonate ABC transporter permease subunit PhnE